MNTISEADLEKRFASLMDTDPATYQIISNIEHKIHVATNLQTNKIEKELKDISSIAISNSNLISIMGQSILSLNNQLNVVKEQNDMILKLLREQEKRTSWF